jgi:hypothetical protein
VTTKISSFCAKVKLPEIASLIAGFLALILKNIGSTFSTFFYFRRAQRDSAEKISKFELEEANAR